MRPSKTETGAGHIEAKPGSDGVAGGGAGPRDAFPSTRRTWLGGLLASGDLPSLRRHVMEVYAEPLRVYCLGCSLRWVGEPADLVSGFFADRLGRPEFFERWWESRRPLRFWLIVGFKHYLLEQTRNIKRDRRMGPLGAEDELDGTGSASADRPFDRQCALELVREALARAESACAEAGLGDYWAAFCAFYLDGQSVEAVAHRLGVTPARAAVMKRTAASRFRSAMRDLVAWNGAGEREIDNEVQSLMEVLR